MSYNLKALGLRSDYQATEFEHALGLKFSEFTDLDIREWQRQTLSLNQVALTRNYTFAAQTAGVTVYTVRAWESDNFLGYAQRKEIAELAFCDWLESLLIDRVQQPESPPSLLAMLLKAHMPEKYAPSRRSGPPSDSRYDRPDHDRRPVFSDADRKALIAEVLRELQETNPASPNYDPPLPTDEAPALQPDVHDPVPHADRPSHEPAPSDHPDFPLDADPALINDPYPNPVPDTPTPHHPTPPRPEPDPQNTPTLNRSQRRQLQRKERKSRPKARAPS